GSGLLISASGKSYQLGSRVAYAQSKRMRRATVEASFPDPLHFSIPNHRTEIVTMLNSAGSKEVSVLEKDCSRPPRRCEGHGRSAYSPSRKYATGNRSHTLWFSLFLVVARRSTRVTSSWCPLGTTLTR